MAERDWDHFVKLLLIGSSTAGGSQLVERFCEDVSPEHFVVKIGIDFKTRRVERNGKKLKVQVWATNGQERFRTITPALYRAAMGLVTVYDITDRCSFEIAQHFLRQFKEQDSLLQNVLVATKCDLQQEREVPTEEGAELASEFGIPFFEVSAKTGEQVDAAFFRLVDQVVEERYTKASATMSCRLLTGEKKKGCLPLSSCSIS